MISSPEEPSVIFSREINEDMGYTKLEQRGANLQPTKAVWLLRESSVPGLITLSYYVAETGRYLSHRMGFVDGHWRFGPEIREAALVFVQKATLAFSNNLPADSADKLFTLLDEYGFDQAGLIRPELFEVTQTPAFLGYRPSAVNNEHTHSEAASSVPESTPTASTLGFFGETEAMDIDSSDDDVSYTKRYTSF